MPVTARLSRKFYEALGEEIANELVDWFNAVDLTYRADLRELNELNFARFDAKLEQRIGALDARMDAFTAKVEQRIGALEARLETFEAKLVQRLESRIGDVKHEMLRWMLASWSTMMLVLLGTLFAVLKAR